MGYWYRVEWFDGAGDGRFTDIEADSDNHAVWQVATDVMSVKSAGMVLPVRVPEFVRVRVLSDAEASQAAHRLTGRAGRDPDSGVQEEAP